MSRKDNKNELVNKHESYNNLGSALADAMRIDDSSFFKNIS